MAKRTNTDIPAVARNWAISSANASQGLYALALVSTDDFSGRTPTSTLDGLASQEFVFDVNPQNIDMEEPFAVHIVPTQDGGQFVENHGQIYKNITISGTTGLRPNKKEGDVIPVLNIPNPFSSPETGPNGLPRGEVSGFEKLLELRNMFRTYADIKKDPTRAHKFILVWQNGKEGEFYVVEPISFRTRRSSGSPLTSNYEIQLRTIQKFDLALDIQKEDPWRDLNALARFNERISDATREIAYSLRVIDSAADSLIGIGQATINNVISPARALLSGLANVASTASGVLDIPRNSVSLLASSAHQLADSLNELDSNYRTLGILTEYRKLERAFRAIARTSTKLYFEKKLFASPVTRAYNKRASAYRSAATGLARTGGSAASMTNVAAPGGTGVTSVGNADTIFTLAKRLLGDQARWKELVILNDLKSPYVSETGDGRNVLRPGDSILFPASGSGNTSAIVSDERGSDSARTKRLGRDLKLVAYDELGGVPVYDLEVSSRKDLAQVEDVDNLIQAILIKFGTERGSLPTHPRFGISAPIGSKATIRSLVGFQMDARQSLLSDERIADVSRLEFAVEGNVLYVDAELQVSGIDRSLPLSFKTPV